MPFLAAAASGLFAEHGLDVELLEPAPGAENVKRVAAGGAECCLTSVVHYCRARAEAGHLAARFVAVVAGRSPMAALVAADSPITQPAHLAGRRVGGPPDNGLVLEYLAALEALGVGSPVVVPMTYAEAPSALGRRQVDAVADFADLLPRVRRQAGIPVRAVRIGLDVYSSGLVAADRLSHDVVRRLRAALVAALERHRAQPEAALRALHARYPDVPAEEALEGWALAVPSIFRPGSATGAMDRVGWERTLGHVARTHLLPPLDVESVYRPAPAGVAA